MQVVNKYGLSRDSLFTTACMHRKKYGENPKWYIVNENNQAYIDESELNRMKQRFNDATKYATNEIYWLLMLIYSNDNKLIKAMLEHPLNERGYKSWHSFLRLGMWQAPKTSLVLKEKFQVYEFLRIGCRLIADYIDLYGKEKLIRKWREEYGD